MTDIRRLTTIEIDDILSKLLPLTKQYDAWVDTMITDRKAIAATLRDRRENIHDLAASHKLLLEELAESRRREAPPVSNRKLKNALIESVSLGYEDHGILTAYLHLDYGGSVQGFGGYGLDGHRKTDPNDYKTVIDGKPFKSRRRPTLECGYFIMRVLETVGVDAWEKLKGKYVRVEHDYMKIYRLGHITDDKWFDISDEMKALATIDRED